MMNEASSGPESPPFDGVIRHIHTACQILIARMCEEKRRDVRNYDIQELAQELLSLARDLGFPLHDDNSYNRQTIMCVVQARLKSTDIEHPAPGEFSFQPDVHLPKHLAREMVRLVQRKSRKPMFLDSLSVHKFETVLRDVESADAIRKRTTQVRSDLAQEHLFESSSQLADANRAEDGALKQYKNEVQKAAETGYALMESTIDLVGKCEEILGLHGFTPYEYEDSTTNICFALLHKYLTSPERRGIE